MTTKREAAEEMVHSFSGIPRDMIFDNPDCFEDYWIEASDDNDDPEWPMWNTLWMINELADEEKIRNDIRAVQKLGFTVITNEKHGWLLLGINGAGYNFYDEHWIPLYDFLGLQWHNES